MKLRSHLVVLVLVVLVPVLAFSAILLVLFARHERTAIEGGLRETTRAVALAVDRHLASSIATLEAVGASEHLTTGDLEAFHRHAQAVLPTQKHWRTLMVLDPSGQQLVNLLRPFGEPLPSAGDREAFKAMVRTGQPTVSGLLVARVGGERNVTVFSPVLRDGGLRYALAATIDPGTLADMLQSQSLVAGGLATILDADHVIIARTSRAPEFVGRAATSFLAEAVRRAPEGLLHGTNADDVRSYGAFSRVPRSGWTVVLSLPADAVEAPLVRSLWGLGAGAAASIAIALCLAALFGRRIARPIVALSASAERIGHGEPPQIPRTRIAEVNEAGEAVEQASRLLRQQDAARERAQAALRHANQVLESLVAGSPLGICILDADGIVRLWNPACERIFGWTAAEVLHRPLPSIDPGQEAEVQANLAATLGGHPLRGVETRRRRKDGSPVEISLSTAALPDGAGQPATVLGLIDDITSRRHAERHRATQYEVSRVLAETPDLAAAAPRIMEAVCGQLAWDVGVLWITDAESGVLRCADVWTATDEFSAFARATRERTFAPGVGMPGRVWTVGEPAWAPDLVMDENFPRRASAIHAGLHAALGFPLMVDRRVLGVIEFFSREIREPDPDLLQLVASVGSQIGQFLDRKRADRALERLLAAEQHARAEAETATAELRRLQSITDATLAPLRVDDLLRELLGRLRAVLGVDTAAVFMVDRTRNCLVLRAADGIEAGAAREPIPLGQGFVGTIALGTDPAMTEDIDQVPMASDFLKSRGIQSLLGAPLLVGGRVTGVLRTGSTLTRAFTAGDARLLQLVADRVALAIENAYLYEAEQRARSEAEAASQAKDQFLAMLAHELRNPLAPIRSATHVIGRLTDEPAVRRARDIVERQVNHLSRLLDDLLDVARITRGKIELVRAPLDLAAAIREALEGAREVIEARGHAVTLSLPDEPISIEADPTRLVQIVGNLLNNAAKYTPPRGSIRVTVRREDDWAVITVKDDGIGIPAEMLPRVFDLFSQINPSFARSEGGLGVGLTLVRRLVELHGGTVAARSEGKGLGSEFTVRLPVSTRPAAPEAGPPPPAVRQRPLRILLVEDNADAAEMLRADLTLDGHDITVAADGTTGVEMAVRDRPDVMLVDIGLPGLDGYEVARQVRSELGAGVLLLALTGYGQPENRDRALAAGFDAHLVKPVDPAELGDLLARHAPA
jgi:PAS domain S-box-containing protein